jgi:hypothetical protein
MYIKFQQILRSLETCYDTSFVIFNNLSLAMKETEPKSKNALNFYKAYYGLSVSTALYLDVVQEAGSLSD